MNKRLFCILYNQAKGEWVVVRESALARGAARYCGCIPMLLRCSLAGIILVNPVLLAQVATAPEAPPANRPQVELTGNNTPLVQITAPNAAGLSNNHYNQFNVDARGVILNNAQGAAMTQLGGAVAGNPALAMGSAGIILNQVVSTHPSLLAGYTEVAGQRADVIIANPNGIVCNGGGFINASRGVLTTGVPVLGASGGLEAFRIDTGLLQIGPKGLDARSLDQVDLLTRSLQVNGEIQTQGFLTVITGPNQVDYASLGMQVLPDAAGSPTVGVDVGLLGGMYARKIHLIGTASGVGVNNMGTLAARGGGFTCTQEGRIVNQGAVHSEGGACLESQGPVVNDQGRITAQQVRLSAGGLSNQGGTIAQAGPGATRLTLKGALDNTAGVIVTNGKDFHLKAHSLVNGLQDGAQGQMVHAGAGRLSIEAGALNNDGGLLVSRGAIGLSAIQDLSNVGGTIHADKLLKVHGRNITNDRGQIASLGGGLSLIADAKLSNAAGTTALGFPGGVISSKTDTVIQTGSLESGGAILSGRHLSLHTGTLTNQGTLSAGARLEAQAETLTNAKGQIGAPSMSLRAAHLDNKGEVTAEALTVNAGTLNNASGTLTHLGEGPLTLAVTGPLTNTQGGRIETRSQDLTLAPQTLDNSGGTIQHAGAGTLSIQVGDGQGALLNRTGSIASHGRMNLGAGSIANPGGTLVAQKQLAVAALQGDLDNGPNEGKRGFIGGEQVRLATAKGSLLNQGGTVEGSGGTTLHVQSLDNTAGIIVNTGDAPLAVTAREAILNAEGFIGSQGETRVGADTLANGNDGKVQSGKDLVIQAGILGNNGILGAKGNMTLGARKSLNNTGELISGAGLAVDTVTLTNVKGRIIAPSVDLKGVKVDNTQGEVRADALKVTGTNLTNPGGKLTHLSASPMVLHVAETLTNTEGGVIQTCSNDPQIETRRLENQGGTIGHLGTGTLSLKAGKGGKDEGVLVNTSGKIASLGQLDLTIGTVHNQGGTLAAQRQVKVIAEGGLDNRALDGKGGIIGAEKVDLATGQMPLHNQGGTIEGSHGVNITAQRLDNAGGTLINSGSTPLTVTAQGLLDNTQGTLGSNGEATVAAGSLGNAKGTLQGGADLTLMATHSLDNTGGMIHANQDLTVDASAATVNNANGQFSATGAVHLKAADVENPGGKIAAGQDLDLLTPTMPSGQLHSGRDTHFRFEGDYTHPAGKILTAKRNLTLATTGTFSNLGSLAAPGIVTVEAGNLHNEDSGLIHGATIQATATQTLISKGRVLGDVVSLQSNRDLVNQGTVAAQETATLTSTHSVIRNPGTVSSQKHVVLSAPEVDSTGMLGAGLDGEGKAVNPGNLTVTASTGRLLATGANTAGGDLTFKAASLSLPKATTDAGGHLTLTATAGGLDHQGAKLKARGTFSATLTGDWKNDAGQIAALHVTAGATSLSNVGGSIAQSGPELARLKIEGAINNTDGTILSAKGAADIGAGAGITNVRGILQAEGVLKLAGSRISNSGGQILSTGSDLDLTATAHLKNETGAPAAGAPGGVISAHRHAGLKADTLENAGRISAGANLTLDGRTLDNSGTLAAQETATFTLTERAGNTGVASAGKDLVVTAPTVVSSGHLGAGIDAQGQAVRPGHLKVKATAGPLETTGENAAGGDITLTAAQLSLSKARTHAGGAITLTATAGEINHQGGKLQAKAHLTATAQAGPLRNDGGQMEAKRVTVNAASLSNQRGSIQQDGPEETRLVLTGPLDNAAEGRIKTNATDLFIESGSLQNDRKGEIQHGGAGLLTLKTGPLDNKAGTLATNGQMTLNAASISNQDGALKAQKGAKLTVLQALNNGNGAIASQGQTTVDANSINNAKGTMLGGPSLIVHSKGQLLNPDGFLQSKGHLEATADGDLTNMGGRIEAGGAGGSASTLVVTAAGINSANGRIVNAGTGDSQITGRREIANSNPAQTPGTGVLGAAGKLTANTPHLRNTQGGQISASELMLDVTHGLDNTASKLYAQDHLTVKGPSTALTNTLGVIGAAGKVNLHLTTLDNTHGEIGNGQQGAGDVHIQAQQSVSNQDGKITSRRDLFLEAASIAGAGVIQGGNDATLRLQGDFTYPGPSTIAANRNLTMETTGTLTNLSSLEAPGVMTARAARLNNTPSGLINGQTTRVTTTQDLLNSGKIYGQDVALGANPLLNKQSNGLSGVVAARGTLNIGGSVTNEPGGLLLSQGDLAIGRTLDAHHQASGTGGQVLNHSAVIQSGKDMSLDAATIVNANPHFRTTQLTQTGPNIVEIQPKYWEQRFLASTLTPTTGQNGIYGCYWVPTGRIVQDPEQVYRQGVARAHLHFMNEPFPGPESIGGWHGLPAGLTMQDLTETLAEAPRMVPEMANIHDYTKYEFKRTTTTPLTQASTPGQLLAGGNMRLAADTIRNDKSKIVAGGSLTLPKGKVDNQNGFGQKVVSEKGTASFTFTEWKGGGFMGGRGHRNRIVRHLPPYNEPPIITQVPLELAVSRDFAALQARPNPATGPSVGQNPASPIPNLTLPNSRLYNINTAPGQSSLVETDPAFRDPKSNQGLDRMLEGLGLKPGATPQRMGDAFFEAQLVGSQIRELTGRMFLFKESTNTHQDFITLMNNGLAAAGALKLEPGVMLTEAQKAELTQDCVWMVNQQITLPDGSRTTVLVPVVFLAKTPAPALAPTGALISAKTITGDLTGSLENSGTLMAESLLKLSASDIRNQGTLATTGAASEMNLFAQNNLASQGAIQGHKVVLGAGQDILFQSTTMDTSASSGTRTGIDRVSTISADTLVAQAGRDLGLTAAQIHTTGDATFQAERNLSVSSLTTGSSTQLGSGKNHLHQSETHATGTQVAAEGNLTFKAGDDFSATAADLTSTKALQVKAGGSVTLDTTDERRHFDEGHHHTTKGTFSSSSTEDRQVRNARTAKGATFTGDTVVIEAGQDVTATGSTVASIGNMAITAAGNVHIKAALNEQSTQSYHHEEQRGLMSSGGIGFSISRREQTDQFDTHATTQSQSRSLMGSTKGSVAIQGGRLVIVESSDLAAQEDILVTGATVAFVPGLDESHLHDLHKCHQTGLTVGLTSNVVEAARDIAGHVQGAVQSQGNATVAALNVLAGAAKARALEQKRPAAKAALAKGGVRGVAAAAGVQVAASIGTSQSQSERTEQTLTHFGSTALAGRHLNIKATEANLEVQGGTLSGKKVNLEAKQDVKLRSARNTTSSRSSNSSSSASLGMSAGVGKDGVGKDGVGLNVDMAASQGQGHSNGDSAIHENITVTAQDLVTIKSDRDTTVEGGQVKAEQIQATVGRDLTIQSQQDTFHFASKQDSASFSASVPIGVGYGSASVNLSQSRANGDFASVNEQSGFMAGAGGLQCTVEGHTTLQGAVLASAAPADRNTFTTGTLSSSDIENHSTGSASSRGCGVGTAVDNWKEGGIALAGAIAGQGWASQNDASTTRSAIAPTITITVTDEQGQQALTGKSSAQMIAELQQTHEGIHRTLERPDTAGLQAKADGKRAINTLAFNTGVAYAQIAMEAHRLAKARASEEMNQVKANPGGPKSGEDQAPDRDERTRETPPERAQASSATQKESPVLFTDPVQNAGTDPVEPMGGPGVPQPEPPPGASSAAGEPKPGSSPQKAEAQDAQSANNHGKRAGKANTSGMGSSGMSRPAVVVEDVSEEEEPRRASGATYSAKAFMDNLEDMTAEQEAKQAAAKRTNRGGNPKSKGSAYGVPHSGKNEPSYEVETESEGPEPFKVPNGKPMAWDLKGFWDHVGATAPKAEEVPSVPKTGTTKQTDTSSNQSSASRHNPVPEKQAPLKPRTSGAGPNNPASAGSSSSSSSSSSGAAPSGQNNPGMASRPADEQGVFGAYWEGFKKAPTNLANAVRHPIQTAKDIVQAAKAEAALPIEQQRENNFLRKPAVVAGAAIVKAAVALALGDKREAAKTLGELHGQQATDLGMMAVTAGVAKGIGGLVKMKPAVAPIPGGVGPKAPTVAPKAPTLGATAPVMTNKALGSAATTSTAVKNTVKGTAASSKAVAEMGKELANKTGKTRVSIKTAAGDQVNIDLKGKAHFEKATGELVETPHVHTSKINIGPDGKSSTSGKVTRPATKQDIRTAKKALEREK